MNKAGTTGTARFDLNGVALLLAGGMCLIPFLQPRHMPPLRAFYDGWLAFALGSAAVALLALAPRKSPLGLPVPAILLAIFAMTLAARAFGQQSAYPQSPLVWALYLAFAGMMLTLGRALSAKFGQENVCEVLAVFILAGALANAFCAALQVKGIPSAMSGFVAHTQGTRATGNVGQANLYANYLALGQASLIYLYAREKVGGLPALACGVLLVACAALAASRASPMYAAGFALLGYLLVRGRSNASTRRLYVASLVLAGAVGFAQWLVPAGIGAIGLRIEGGVFRSTPANFEGPLPDEAANLRLSAWALALKIFFNAPWMGVGPDEFAGAAFKHGLPPEMAGNQLWTSPHNLILHLLAETGMLGATLVCAALLAWLLGASRQFFRIREPSMWWLLACVGVEMLHAMLEYPLWYAHFLAVAALLMGVGATGGIAIGPSIVRMVFGICALVGAILLSFSLGAYLKFDLASPIAAGRSLAHDKDVARDRAVLAELGNSLLAPRVETWLFLSFPLDDAGLEEKLEVGDRTMRLWPSREVAIRQTIFLALAGRNDEAVALLNACLMTFPAEQRMFVGMVESAPQRAREALEPALRKHQARPGPALDVPRKPPAP